MREKLGTVAVVIALVVAWGGGFLWFRGDLKLPFGSSDDKPAAAAPTAGASASAPAVDETPGAAAASYKGNVSLAQERKAVDINPREQRPVPLPLAPLTQFRLASFNVLGASHTGGGGKAAGRPSGAARMGGALAIIRTSKASVVGFQEMQGSQRSAFRAGAPGWKLYPDDSLGNSGENSIGWDTKVWDLVKPAAIPIPYFNGNVRQMPYILLRHKATGVQAYFANFHNPADTRKFRNQQRFRTEAQRREAALFTSLQKQQIPVFVTGDMNGREEFFCPVASASGMVSASGARVVGGACQVPKPVQIDWILGSPAVQFGNYTIDRGALSVSDHPMISASVLIDTLKFPNAYTSAAPSGQ